MGFWSDFVATLVTPIAAPVVALTESPKAAINSVTQPYKNTAGAVQKQLDTPLGQLVKKSLTRPDPRRYLRDPSAALQEDFQSPMKHYDELSGNASARRDQAARMGDQAAEQEKLLAEANKRKSDEQTLAAATALQRQMRSKPRTGTGGGRRGTILTGPLGLPSGGYNTLLGGG